jgi:DNA-binding CsgD family transcriptional regulator/PAS domain-containing protein
MEEDRFSELIGALYDGAVDSALWPHALGRICETFGFRKGTLDLNRLPAMSNLFNCHYGINEREAATMVRNYPAMPEVWGGLAATMTRPIDRPWVVSRIMTQEALRQTAYYRDWVGPMGLVDGAAIVLARDAALFGSIRLATDARRGIIDDALIEALARLLPHCQRAARISGLLDAAQGAARNFQAVIDSMSVPILLLSGTSAVVHANPQARALLEEGTVLGMRWGRLVSPIAGLQRAIDTTIARLVHDEGAIPGRGTGLSVHAGAPDARTLHILPLAKGDMRARLADDAVAALFLSPASGAGTLPKDMLQSLFDLTSAELTVFEHILSGSNTRQIAADLGVASSTVRTHVLRLFQKTATHCRSDLIRLAHGLAPPVAN